MMAILSGAPHSTRLIGIASAMWLVGLSPGGLKSSHSGRRCVGHTDRRTAFTRKRER